MINSHSDAFMAACLIQKTKDVIEKEDYKLIDLEIVPIPVRTEVKITMTFSVEV